MAVLDRMSSLAYLRRWRCASLAVILLGPWLTCHTLFRAVQAQVTISGRAKNFVAPVTDAQGRKSVIRGSDAKPAGPGKVDITGMHAETFRGKEKDMVVEAKQCLYDTRANVATSPGPLSIRTADERFSIEGETFRWQLGDTRMSSRLVISNRVHSLVRKRLVAGAQGQGPGLTREPRVPPATASKTNATALTPPAASSTNDFIEVRSEQFEYEGDRATYHGQVRVHDEEGDLACDVLTVFFRGESGALERIEADQNVSLVQPGTRGTADKAIYTVGPDREIVDFIGHAIWEAGGRQGSGQRVSFDRRRRVIHAEEQAYIKLPRSVLGEAGFLSGTPTARTSTRTDAGASATNGFVEVYSDLMTIQLPPTNGPVRQVIAEKNVLIVDADQDARALADRAEFVESTGILELTGSPLLETEQRLVNGKTLRFDRNTKVFSAGPDAYVRLPFRSVTDLGLVSTSPATGSRRQVATNEFIEVWAQLFEYHTNLLHFTGNVRVNFLKETTGLGKLTCASLTIRYAEQVQSLLAEQDVEMEQFAATNAGPKVARTVHCERLRAEFNAQGRLETAVFDQKVTAEQEESRKDRAMPVISTLTSDMLTAFFSPVTNRVDRVVADRDVIVSQEERTARGNQAVYNESSGLLELLGQPSAQMPEGKITQAERLVWDRSNARLIGRGKFKSVWKAPAGASTNQMNIPTPAKKKKHRAS